MKNELGTAVITGASSGLGKVFADRLAKQGYDLKIIARRGDRLETIAGEITAKYGVQVQNIVADLRSASELQKVVDNLSNDATITLLVNNAGTATLAKITDTSIEKQLEMINVNITAIAILTNTVLPIFKKNNRGTFINIASVLGIHSLEFSSVYSGTKAFVVNYTRGLQQELKDTNIKAQIVLPATTATEIWEIGGVPLSALKPATIMTSEDCVDATLKALELGEQFTLPSADDQHLIDEYENARLKLFASATQTGKPASRYHVSTN
ncbi:MAG TPA: SDR family oxidoreductase [Arachidicoccus sp.]